MSKKIKDLTGKVFRYLTVIKYAGHYKNTKNSSWLCKCICGKELVVCGDHLRSGHMRSCRCMRGKLISETLEKRGNTKEKSLYLQYKWQANRRKIPWHLTKEQFIAIIYNDCHYCKGSPENRTVGGSRSILSNGVDRKDNSHQVGYTVANCVPCCKTCNDMKGSLSAERFVEQAKKIAAQLLTNDARLIHIAAAPREE